MKVVIIDYQMGNTKSVLRSFQKFTSDVIISQNPKDLETASHIVLPGVGSFSDGIDNLHRLGFIDILTKEVKENKIPFLGICLGMQMLATVGFEGSEKNGLNFIEGKVEKLIPQGLERVPHVGWNDINKKSDHPIVDNIDDYTDFYFVHSYHFLPKSQSHIVATTPYLQNIVSIIADDNIVGVQFHPEKSQVAGFKIIENFLKL